VLSPLKEILFIFVIFASNTIQGITGFAGSLLSVPPSILLIGVNEARTVINIVALLSALMISIQSYKWLNKRELAKIVGFMSVGMLIGFKLYNLLAVKFLLVGYGILILLVALKGLFIKRELNVPKILTGNVILLVSGIIHAMFVSGGALLVVYAVSALKDKNEFRATIAPVWVILNTIMIFNHAQNGYFTKDVNILILMSIIPMVLGVWLGHRLYKRIDQALFMKFTYSLLVVSGLMVIF
jgi:uncharacterized protein